MVSALERVVGRSLPEDLEMPCKILELEEGSRLLAQGAAKPWCWSLHWVRISEGRGQGTDYHVGGTEEAVVCPFAGSTGGQCEHPGLLSRALA